MLGWGDWKSRTEMKPRAKGIEKSTERQRRLLIIGEGPP